MTAAALVERVAEAIAIAGNGGAWDDWYNPAQKEFHRKRARAAIEAVDVQDVLAKAREQICSTIDVAHLHEVLIGFDLAAIAIDAALGERK